MPPERSAGAHHGTGEHPLPIPLTPLLGRERELDETLPLLARTRLLTITGAGGSGKTRLALELAHRAAARYETVIWVDLAPIAEPDLIGQQILNALGIREAPTAEVMQVIIDSPRERPALLVLDNCEHLVDACAMVSESILRACPATTILATTREALGIAGEQTWLVPPLSVTDATQLFAERARAARPPGDRARRRAGRRELAPGALTRAAAVLLSQPKGATKEQIGAALWPGADAARLRNNFHVALHRLRKLLGGSANCSRAR